MTLTPAGLAKGGLVKRFVADQRRLWTAPVREPGQALRVGVPLAAATALLAWGDQPLMNRYVQQPHPWAQRISRGGDLVAVLGGSAALWGVGKLARHETTEQMGESALLALMHSAVMTQGLKALAWRQRPDGSTHWSMPSGHAMTSFAIAGAITAHPRAPRWLRIALPVAAGAVAVSRVGARRHYMSDVAVGGALGWVMGRSLGRR